MFTSTVIVGFTALLCSSFNFVDARTVKRDVVSPPITYPTTGTVWNVNDRHNVTWDTSVIPPGTTNNGMIVLGFLDSADGSNEHLDLNNPLASGFPITAGRAEITVPSVTTRDTYILVLFGDSGNASGKFTINNISISATSSSTASSIAASSSASPASASTTDVQSASSGQGTSTASSPASSPASPSAASSTQNGAPGSATGSVGATAGPASSASNPSSASRAVSSSVPATQTQPAAQSASPSRGSSTNAGVRTASYGDGVTWISTMCSLAVVVGFAL